MRKIINFITALFLILSCGTLSINAKDAVYTNPDTGYSIYIDDDADLLSDQEEDDLLEKMKDITGYGGAAFVSTSYNSSTTSRFAENRFREYFKDESATLFVIDMDNREIYIFSDGDIYRTVSRDYADTITDNTYRYASKRDYYGCAEEAFSEIQILLDGGKIARPMKIITNILLALILAVILNYLIVLASRKKKYASASAAVTAITALSAATVVGQRFKSQSKRYIERDSGSSSSGGFSGGGGGGGFSSGGGGGHSF